VVPSCQQGAHEHDGEAATAGRRRGFGGFTDEELNFIINYEIKYRMGQDSGEDQEGE
jgi:hypothetical protein